MGLLAALDVGRGSVVALVGAGGKTTLAFRLAEEARAAGLRVVVTTTTHMGLPGGGFGGAVLVEEDGGLAAGLAAALAREGRAVLLGRRVRPDKVEGVLPARVDALRALADLVVVEADGARGRSLKTPAPHEPVLPSSTTHLVVLAAADVVGLPLTAADVHRVDRAALACGLRPGDLLDARAVARVLADPFGYPARRPAGARLVAFLNRAESEATLIGARAVASHLLPPYDLVLAGRARTGQAALAHAPGPPQG